MVCEREGKRNKRKTERGDERAAAEREKLRRAGTARSFREVLGVRLVTTKEPEIRRSEGSREIA